VTAAATVVQNGFWDSVPVVCRTADRNRRKLSKTSVNSDRVLSSSGTTARIRSAAGRLQ
jgi:hypothetical protein